MTTPEVDQELERLFTVTRAATAPDTDARARIRAGVALQLASGTTAVASTRGLGKWKWLGIGAAVLGLGAFGLGLSSKPNAAVNAPEAAVPSVIEPAVVQAPSAVAAPAAPAPVVESAAPAAPHVSARPQPKASEPSKPEPAASTAPDPAEELQLVRAMQQALRSGNPSQALTLAGEHAKRFPSGTLAQEREGVRAIARCQLAKPEARAGVLEQFNQRFGSSPYAARVRAACQ